jgi:hypothetical protein
MTNLAITSKGRTRHRSDPLPLERLLPRSKARMKSGRFYTRLRGSADRSWLSGRTTVPAVASPPFPDEPTHDDDHLREGHPEIDYPFSPLRAPHQLLVGVVPGARPLHYPALRCLKWPTTIASTEPLVTRLRKPTSIAILASRNALVG